MLALFQSRLVTLRLVTAKNGMFSVKVSSAFLAARSRHRQVGRPTLGLAAEGEQQGHQAHRVVDRPAAKAAGQRRTLARDTHVAHPPALNREPEPDTTGIDD